MAELFEKSLIKSLELPNRAVRSATWSGVADEKGHVTDSAERVYGDLARGGVGLIITGFQYVLPNGVAMPRQVGNYDDGCFEGLKRMADLIHAAGAKVVAQIVHTGAKANPKLFPEPGEIWGASAIKDPQTENMPKEMTVAEIAQVVEAYAAAAARSKKAGFDGVQLHGAHGYGINQFLSAAANKRSDAYGGDIDNRYRILGEVMEAVRGAVGDDFPVMIKLSGADYYQGGLTVEESLQVGRRLGDDGIDAIEVSGGSRASYDGKIPSRKKIKKESDEAYLLDLAAGFKAAVNVPIITVGGVRSPGVIERILSEGKADYVSMCRPLIREPGLVNRWKSGDRAPAKCISCNGCFETTLEGRGVFCKVDAKKKKG